MSKAKPYETNWFDGGPIPVEFAFVPTEQAWKDAVKEIGEPDWPYPEHAACCSTLRNPGKPFYILVTVNPPERASELQIAATLAHEAVHVMQFALEFMTAPGQRVQRHREVEAYMVQWAFQCCFDAWQKYEKWKAKQQ